MAFDTSILDRVLEERRKRLEGERKELLVRVVKTLQEIRKRFGIKEAYVVGSLVEPGRWADCSDVDVAVVVKGPLDRETVEKIYEVAFDINFAADYAFYLWDRK